MNATPTNLADFRIVNKLGEGAFSTVFVVVRKADQQEYALKKVVFSSISEKERANALNEVRILASLRNPYIIDYKEAFFDDQSQSLCLILEYAREGDLHKKIQLMKKQGKFFSEADIWRCMMHLSKGLGALHNLQIFHRDLKSANVFLCKEIYKLGDLNVSISVGKGMMAKTQTGTPFYASPEVWRESSYDQKSDIWSLGCVIYEMASLQPPFRAPDMQGLFNKVQKGSYERIPMIYSEDLQTIIAECLQINPVHRPTCAKIQQDISKYGYANSEGADGDSENPELMKTIEIPKLWRTVKLPGSRYGRRSASPPRRGEGGRIVSAGLSRNLPDVVRFPSYPTDSSAKPARVFPNLFPEEKKLGHSPFNDDQRNSEPAPHQKPEFLRNARRNMILDNYNKNKAPPALSPILEGVVMQNAELRKNIAGVAAPLSIELNNLQAPGRLLNKFKKFGAEQQENSPQQYNDNHTNFNNVRLATGQSVVQENKKMMISRPLWWG